MAVRGLQGPMLDASFACPSETYKPSYALANEPSGNRRCNTKSILVYVECTRGSKVLTTTSLQFPQAFPPFLSQTDVPGTQFAHAGEKTEGAFMVAVWSRRS